MVRRFRAGDVEARGSSTEKLHPAIELLRVAPNPIAIKAR